MADIAASVAAGDLSFIAEAPLHDWVVGQRWFASKSREVASRIPWTSTVTSLLATQSRTISGVTSGWN